MHPETTPRGKIDPIGQTPTLHNADPSGIYKPEKFTRRAVVVL